MFRPRIIGLWALGLLTGLAAASEPDPEPWLERMADSLRSRSYEGTFVYLNGYHLKSMRIVRAVDGEHEREHLVTLNGARREIVRDGEAVTSILPHARSIFARDASRRASFPAVLGESYTTLQVHYRFLVSASDRIAGRETVRIRVVPKDEYRYGYRLWLDSETAIPLRVAQVDEQGIPLEQVMFTQFRLLEPAEVPDIPAVAPAPAGGDTTTRPERLESAVERWRLEGLPSGFLLHSQRAENMPGSPGQVQHLVFTDGLVAVSAYIEKMENRHGLQGGSRRGSISAFGKRQSGYQVTVVGEVPPRTVEQIAHSIQVSPDD